MKHCLNLKTACEIMVMRHIIGQGNDAILDCVGEAESGAILAGESWMLYSVRGEELQV